MSGPGTTGTTRGLAWSQLGDETLARRAASGSDAAFTALYERYHGRLLAYCRSILLNAEDAHDATQNALENALRGLPTRDDGRPLRPWLYRIAHNEAISIMRRRQPHDELMPDTEPVSGLQPSPEVYAEQRGRMEQLVEDLRTLPERQRGALVMRELSGLSYDEIGVALGLTPANARRAVFDARSALLDVAGGRDAECVTIRHALSDGDRRSVRARRIRAHLRSCDGCSTFHTGIRTRQTDLPAIAPWLTGAAAVSAIGIGIGGSATGGGLLAGGLGWGAMSGAAKGLAVVAIVATTGTAALQIERAAKPGATGGAPKTASRAPRAAAADASAAAPAVMAQVAARRATRSTVPSARRQNASTGSRGGGGQVMTRTDATLKSSTVTTAHKSKAPQTKGTKIPSASAPTPTSVSKPPEAAKPPSDLLADKLQAIHDQLVAAFAQAQNIAAAGTQGALQNASQLVASTISSVQSMLSSLLGSFGITVPTAVVSAPAPPSSPSSLSGLLSPVQQVLGSVNALLAQLFGLP